jgi:hypothetical protein
MRNQHQLQQQKQSDVELSRGPVSQPNVAKETDSYQLPTTTARGTGDESRERRNHFATAYNDESSTGAAIALDGDGNDDGNTFRNQSEHQQLHPPDCLCTLRKQLRGMNFFLPPPSLTSAMKQPNDFYCHEATSAEPSNRTK